MRAEPAASPPTSGAATYARPFSAVAGGALLILGLLGILGNPLLATLTDLSVTVAGPTHDLGHIVLGALYLHVAFALTGRAQATSLIVLGIVSLLLTLLTFVSADAFGLLDEGANLADQLLHLAIGGASLAIGVLMRSGTPLRLRRAGS